jgi:hypothetical protein
MANQAQHVLVSASGGERPRSAATFADLPAAHRDELIKFALVAAGWSAFLITLALLARPLPSRSLSPAAALPHGTTPPGDALVAARVQPAVDLRPSQSLRRRSVDAPRASYQAVSVEEDDAVPAPAQRRGHAVTRFFRTVFRWTAQPPTAKADGTQQ